MISLVSFCKIFVAVAKSRNLHISLKIHIISDTAINFLQKCKNIVLRPNGNNDFWGAVSQNILL